MKKQELQVKRDQKQKESTLEIARLKTEIKNLTQKLQQEKGKLTTEAEVREGQLQVERDLAQKETNRVTQNYIQTKRELDHLRTRVNDNELKKESL